MSIFGFYFVTGLMQEAGWPRRKGLFNSTAVIDTIILDAVIDQMIDWAAGLGAGRPTLALQTIAEMHRDRDWNSDERPDIKVFIEGVRTENENWRATSAIAPHDVVQPTRFAGADAHRQAVEGIMKNGSKWKGPTMDVKDFKETRPLLEHFFQEGVLWGLVNAEAFETWYQAHHEDQIQRLPLMRQADLAVGELPNLPQFLADSEEILRNYERDVCQLPAVPESLLADARTLGVRL